MPDVKLSCQQRQPGGGKQSQADHAVHGKKGHLDPLKIFGVNDNVLIKQG